MRQCVQCKKRGLFLRLNFSYLCRDCEKKNKEEAEALRRKQIGEAGWFIYELSNHVGAALAHSTILPHWGREKIRKQYDECQYVLRHMDEWKNYKFFKEAFYESLRSDGRFKRSQLFPNRAICENPPISFDELFADLKKRVSNVASDCFSAELRAYDYSKLFTVVGVTFCNGRRHRQTILRAIRFKDSPYNGTVKFRIEKYLYEGEPAFAVYANEEQVGNIARADIPWMLEHWPEYFSVDEYDIPGGNGYSYGLDIRVCFRKQNPAK